MCSSDLESLEISDFERAIDRLSAAGTDASASEFWGSDEAYLDQLATAMDLYLERNGLFAEDEDEELSPLHAHARSQGHSGGEISADEIDPSDPQYAHRGELDRVGARGRAGSKAPPKKELCTWTTTCWPALNFANSSDAPTAASC